jgi:hypothetical protein
MSDKKYKSIYEKSKIYCIRSNHTDKVYFGSTIGTLNAIMSSYRSKYKRYLDGKTSYNESFKIIKYDDNFIELLEDFPCSSKLELETREGDIIKTSKDAINKITNGKTSKEIYKENFIK